MKEVVEQVIREDLNPKLAMHGGGCELVSCEDGVVTLRLVGGCSGCPGRQMTLMGAIVPVLRAKVQGLKDVQLER
jgi:Fe-S cluster biogenesis protein NfuA